MKGTAEEITPKDDVLEIHLYRVTKKKKFHIAGYRFASSVTIARIIHFLNENSENKILEGYIEQLEKLARMQCKEALGERRVD